MNMRTHSLDDLLGLNKYEIDERSHISVVEERCTDCQKKVCLVVCPAEVYVLREDRIVIRHENCLECGACSIACNAEGSRWVDWRNPRGGYGIVYQYG